MASEMSALIGADLAQLRNLASQLQAPLANPLSAEGNDGAAMSFADSFKQAVMGVNEKDRVAGERMADVDAGRSDDLVGAMLASQDASLSFSMLMQVRNKVVGAVDELIKLQL
ncbi:flagellar hook-basal body complex protein FliE [Uliginosibacterium sp. sgz301328]